MSITVAIAVVIIVAIVASVIYLIYDSQQETIRQGQKLSHERQLLEGGYVQAAVRLYTTRSHVDKIDELAVSNSDDVMIWKKPGEKVDFSTLEIPQTLVQRPN